MNADTSDDIDALRKRVEELEAEHTVSVQRVSDLIVEKWRLQDRITELEAHPPADRDLRDDLVCSLYPILLAAAWSRQTASTTAAEMAETHAAMRELALVEADKMIAAMRKGDTNGK